MMLWNPSCELRRIDQKHIKKSSNFPAFSVTRPPTVSAMKCLHTSKRETNSNPSVSDISKTQEPIWFDEAERERWWKCIFEQSHTNLPAVLLFILINISVWFLSLPISLASGVLWLPQSHIRDGIRCGSVGLLTQLLMNHSFGYATLSAGLFFSLQGTKSLKTSL